MNFKALNIEKGFKRIWILGSGFWVLYPLFPPVGSVFGSSLFFSLDSIKYNIIQFTSYLVISQIIWWAILFLVLLIARGFVDDDDTKAGF